MIREDVQEALDDLGNYSMLFGASNGEVEEGIAKEAKDWLIIYIASLESQLARLEAENATLRGRMRWIPVSERLPERDGFYLVLEDVNQVAGYYHWCRAFGWNTDGGRINIQSVTHWMPLPETPKGDEE